MELHTMQEAKLKPLDNFVTVADAKRTDIITEPYMDLFVDRCSCGSDMMLRIIDGQRIISVDDFNNGVRSKPSVTAYTCCNPNCTVKLPYHLVDFFSSFNIKGLGEGICKKVVRYHVYSLGNPNVTFKDIVLNGKSNTGLSGAEHVTWCQAFDVVNSSKQTFSALVNRFSYAHIGTRFDGMFVGCSSVLDFLLKVNKTPIDTLLINIGVKSASLRYYFQIAILDILELVQEYSHTLVTSNFNYKNICMTGKMTTSLGAFTKDKFIQACIELHQSGPYANHFELRTTTSVAKASYVIAGENSVSSGTAKYKQALSLQSSYDFKFLFTPDSFLKHIGGLDELR